MIPGGEPDNPFCPECGIAESAHGDDFPCAPLRSLLDPSAQRLFVALARQVAKQCTTPERCGLKDHNMARRALAAAGLS